MDQYDLGRATYAIMLVAADLGLGTGHSAVGEQDKARAILGVPDTHLVVDFQCFAVLLLQRYMT